VTVDPSSLIFVAIIGIWAAYLLGHWVRRREQVATARSIDRFSAAMRVLEKRPAMRSIPLSRAPERAYVVAPARSTAAQVVVKRAPAVTKPDPAQPQPHPDVAAPAAGTTRPPGRRPSQRPVSRPPAGSARSRAGLARRKVDGLVLLLLLAATPVSWLLVALTSLSWWFAALVTAALVGAVVRLRRAVQRRQRLARRHEHLERRAHSRRRRQGRRDVVDRVARAGSHTEIEVAAGPVEADVVPDAGWQPVPVPPPTYTLKPKAPPRPAQRPVATGTAAPGQPSSPSQVEAPAAVFDLDEILERRIASNG
jgi:hypothetical protein